MEPLIALLAVTGALLLIGAAGVRWLRPWTVPLRGGLAAMFVLTGVSHFVGMRGELIEMVPPWVPAPELVITVTGVLELLGAAGLLVRRTAPLAAGALALMLVAMFPANVYAALEGIASTTADYLLPRTLIQIVFLAALLAVVVSHVHAARVSSPRLATRSRAIVAGTEGA
ncbi:DoxX family protein [Agromyces albus]|uniref:DoxX family membrane protein n=1 Tax=Agromyces albus TaxID=205332 RepID=A0A4Q2KW01_9MICO|nr:DoxX family membrane protein [Agromyces albus]RXZ68002.1 DoxX family membrane protein [Agromyces albus]